MDYSLIWKGEVFLQVTQFLKSRMRLSVSLALVVVFGVFPYFHEGNIGIGWPIQFYIVYSWSLTGFSIFITGFFVNLLFFYGIVFITSWILKIFNGKK